MKCKKLVESETPQASRIVCTHWAQFLRNSGRCGYGHPCVSPAQAQGVLKTKTEERRRSLFKVPVFQADLQLEATLDLTGVPGAAPDGALLDWSRAELIVGDSDARGALADATLSENKRMMTLVLAQSARNVLLGVDKNQQRQLTLFGAPVRYIARPEANFNVSAVMKFSGAQRIAMLVYGKTTHLTVEGDWRNPGFDGGFLPIS